MPTYDPTDHPLLSAAAQALQADDVDAFLAQADAAEAMLGLAGTGFSGADAKSATLAVAYWINCQLAASADGGREIKSESKGDQAVSYVTAADKTRGRSDPCALAQMLAEQLLRGSAFEPMLGVR